MNERELTLDPDDWSPARDLLHRAVDDAVAYLESVRDRPVWQPMDPSICRDLAAFSPQQPTDLETVYDEVIGRVRPYVLGNIHPRFWGWVPGSGTVGGVLAEIVKSSTNSVSAAFDEVDRFLEHEVTRWMREAFGMPTAGSGILASGGSMANIVGLTVARDAKAEIDIRDEGVRAMPRPMMVYCSSATHSSVDKAMQMLGLGRRALRRIPADADHRLPVDALRQAIAADRAAGRLPAIVVGNAGTVDIGATDDLERVADVATEEGLWLHVDGAFGAIAALSPALRNRVAGLGRADSLAFDFHKWLHVPYGAGCVLFRDESTHRNAFQVPAPYLSRIDRGPAAQPRPSYDYGPELSRGAKALKVWIALREHGLETYGRLAAQNVAQAAALGRRLDAEPDLELLASVPLNIVCFRYRPPAGLTIPDSAIDQINREILMRLQEEGTAVPSHTVLDGAFAIRVCITSHRTRRSDLDLLVDEVLRLGAELALTAE